MTRAEALARLRAREPELRAMGIERLSLFGSTARDEARADSDLDLAAKLRSDQGMDAFRFVGLEIELGELLGARVDLVNEPSDAARLQAEIDRDRVPIF